MKSEGSETHSSACSIRKAGRIQSSELFLPFDLGREEIDASHDITFPALQKNGQKSGLRVGSTN